MLIKTRSPSIIPEIFENQEADENTNTTVDLNKSMKHNYESEKPKLHNTIINDTLNRYMLLDRLTKRKQYGKSELDQIKTIFSIKAIDNDANRSGELLSTLLTPKQKLYRRKILKLASTINKKTRCKSPDTVFAQFFSLFKNICSNKNKNGKKKMYDF